MGINNHSIHLHLKTGEEMPKSLREKIIAIAQEYKLSVAFSYDKYEQMDFDSNDR